MRKVTFAAAAAILLAGVLPVPLGEVTVAGDGPSVTVATLNVCKRTCGSGRYAWKYRRAAAVRSIAASGADVVAVQEAAGTVRQLARRLRVHGYRLANSVTAGCGRGCTRDSFLFYRSATVAPLGSEGTATLSSVTASWAGTFDRGWSWAYFVHPGTGARFLVTSVHLPNGKSREMGDLRVASTQGVVAALQANKSQRGLLGIPTLIAGDLNSFACREPRGPQWVLAQAGFRDAFTAPDRRNARVPTVNVTRRSRDPFPARPFRFRHPARIDYVMFDQGSPLHYEVFLKLRGGRFDDRFRASDHNMVIGTVKLPVL